jgi:hypothetical protein
MVAVDAKIRALVAQTTAIHIAAGAVWRPDVRTPSEPDAVEVGKMVEPLIERVPLLIIQGFAAIRGAGKAAVTAARR